MAEGLSAEASLSIRHQTPWWPRSTTQLGTGQGQEGKGCAWGQWPQDDAGGLGFAWPCMQPDPSPHMVTHLTGHHPELHPAPVALFCIYPVGGLGGGGRVRTPQPSLSKMPTSHRREKTQRGKGHARSVRTRGRSL